jgi:hypothetical protein
MPTGRIHRRLRRWLPVCTLLLALLVGLSGTAAGNPIGTAQAFRLSLPMLRTAPPPPPPPAPRVDVWVQLGSSALAFPGERVRLNIFMRNIGTVDAGRITLRVPFNNNLAGFFTYHIDQAGGDRFLGVTNGNNAGIEVNRRIAPGQTHQVSMWFNLRNDVPDGAIFRLSADYQFGGVTGRTNQTNVTVLRTGGEIAGGFCGPFRGVDGKFSVSPVSGSRGTRFIFSSDCFVPGEEVVTWLNVTPGVVRPLDLRARADGGGRVVFQLDSSTLAPGDTYGLVASGRSSGLQILGPFIVTGTRAAGVAADPLIIQLPADAAPTLTFPLPSTLAELSAAPAQAATGGVSGQVVGESDVALNDVIVTAFNANREIVDATRSDASGAYALSGLRDGAYTIGFLASLSGDPTTALYASRLVPAVVSNGAVTTLNAGLTRGGYISGRVTGATAGDLPLEGVTVFVYDSTDTLAGVALTDATGVYTSTALLSGTYRVEFDPTRSSVPITTNYLGTTVNASVTAPAVTRDVDATLVAAETEIIQLSGRVTAADTSLPLANITVAVVEAETGEILEVTTTNFAGAYQTTAIPPGRYRIFALTMRANTEVAQRYVSAEYGSIVEQTSGGAVNGINFALQPGTQVNGRVTGVDTGAPLSGVSVTILNTDGVVLSLTETDTDGVYRTPAVGNGDYTLRFNTAAAEVTIASRYRGINQDLSITDSPEPLFGVDVQLEPWPDIVFLPSLGG